MKVGLLGHGVVGSGVAEILTANQETVSRNARQNISLEKIVCLNDIDAPYAGLRVQDAAEVTAAPDIDIVVECMGGVEPAFSFLSDALRHGKHCVSSNKELVVEKGAELCALAREHGVYFLYEASCGGGIPVLHPLQYCLGANNIESVQGILNGTTNYILTRMKEGGISYQDALAEAQSLGYAEKDPTADVEGHDARRKIAILSHLAFGSALLDDRKYPCRGISALTYEDIQYAEATGRVIKLLGLSRRDGEGYTASVAPCMLPKAHPLAGVSGVFNAIMVHGDRVGDVMFYGPGAGKDPTASAVVSDVIEIAAGHADYPALPAKAPAFVPAGKEEVSFFVRVDCAGANRADLLRNLEAKLPGMQVHTSPSASLDSFALDTPPLPMDEIVSILDDISTNNVRIGEIIRILQ